MSIWKKIDRKRAAVFVGSGIGGIQTVQTQYDIIRERGPSRCSPFTIPGIIVNMASGLIGIDLGFEGANYSAVSACATGNHNLGEALRMIQRGAADIAVAGGSEAGICEISVSGFCAMKALCASCNDEPEKGSRPFDAGRDGFCHGRGLGDHCR